MKRMSEMNVKMSTDLVPYIIKAVLFGVMMVICIIIPLIPIGIIILQNWRKLWMWFSQEGILEIPRTEDEKIITAYKAAKDANQLI